MEAATDHRGDSYSSFTEEMLQDIDDAVRNRNPKSENRWDTWVLQRYIFDAYGKKCSCEWIRQILHKLGNSHKRSTKRSTRANKEAQEAFTEGAVALVDEFSHRDYVRLFALDETGIRLEPNSFYGWAPKGLPLYAETNGGPQGS